jgi:hypothetical protein
LCIRSASDWQFQISTAGLSVKRHSAAVEKSNLNIAGASDLLQTVKPNPFAGKQQGNAPGFSAGRAENFFAQSGISELEPESRYQGSSS